MLRLPLDLHLDIDIDTQVCVCRCVCVLEGEGRRSETRGRLAGPSGKPETGSREAVLHGGLSLLSQCKRNWTITDLSGFPQV